MIRLQGRFPPSRCRLVGGSAIGGVIQGATSVAPFSITVRRHSRPLTDVNLRPRGAGGLPRPELAPDRDNPGRGERLVDGGGHDRASEDKDRQDGGETSNSQEGVQGSHHGHSRVLRGTLCGQKRLPRFSCSACLYLSCGQVERCLNLGLAEAMPEFSVFCRRLREAGQPVSQPVQLPLTCELGCLAPRWRLRPQRSAGPMRAISPALMG